MTRGTGKTFEEFRFRPTYAGANVGHPDSSAVAWRKFPEASFSEAIAWLELTAVDRGLGFFLTGSDAAGGPAQKGIGTQGEDYFGHVNNYSRSYGHLNGVVMLLLWLYASNGAILIGEK